MRCAQSNKRACGERDLNAKANCQFSFKLGPSSRTRSVERTPYMPQIILLVPEPRPCWPALADCALLNIIISIVLSCQPLLAESRNSAQPPAVQQKFTLARTLTDDRFIYSVAFAPDGETVASHNVDDVVKLWDAQTGALRRTLAGDSRRNVQPNSLAFAPDGKTLAGTEQGERLMRELLRFLSEPNK